MYMSNHDIPWHAIDVHGGACRSPRARSSARQEFRNSPAPRFFDGAKYEAELHKLFASLVRHTRTYSYVVHDSSLSSLLRHD